MPGASQRYFKQILGKGGTLYLMVEWLTTTFTLVLTNGDEWWETPAGGVQRNLNNVNFNNDQEWLDTLSDALCKSQPTRSYDFEWMPHRTQLRIRWPNPSGGPPCIYDIPVHQVSDGAHRGELLGRMLSTLANTNTALQETIRSLTATCSGLSGELRRQQEDMRQQNKKAAERDRELFIKFTILLNTKKAKLAELKARVDTLETEVKVLNAKTDEELFAIDGLDAVLGDNNEGVHSQQGEGAAAADSPSGIEQQVEEQHEEEEARELQQQATAMDVEEQAPLSMRMPRLTLPPSQPSTQSAPAAKMERPHDVSGNHLQQWGNAQEPPPVTATQAALFAAPTQDPHYRGETQVIPPSALLKYKTDGQQDMSAQGAAQQQPAVGLTASALAPFYAADTLPATLGTQAQVADLDDVDVDVGL